MEAIDQPIGQERLGQGRAALDEEAVDAVVAEHFQDVGKLGEVLSGHGPEGDAVRRRTVR